MRRLFTSLEFRTLFERLEWAGAPKPALEVADLDLRETDPGEVGTLLSSDGPKAVRLDLDERRVRGVAVSLGGGQAAYHPRSRTFRRWRGRSPTRTSPSGPRRQGRRDGGGGRGPGAPRTGNGHDARGVPARPRRGELRAGALSEQYLGADVVGSAEEAEGQLFGSTWRTTAAESAAVALLAPLLDERVGKAGLRRSWTRWNCRCRPCSRACRRTASRSTSSI